MNQSPRPVVILDFGAQYAQLIARRVREQHVYSVIVPCNVPLEELRKLNPQAIILSGGPASVYDPGSPSCDDRVFEMRVPILGICYGLQLMSWKLGGKVERAERRGDSFGPAQVSPHKPFGCGLPPAPAAWEQYG